MSYFDTEKKPGKLLKTQEILPLLKCGNPDRMKKKNNLLRLRQGTY